MVRLRVSRLMRAYIVAGAFVCLAAVSAVCQPGESTRTVVATLLLSDSQTTDKKLQAENYLSVAATGGEGFVETKSWLYFDASALPGDIHFLNVQLQLSPMQDPLGALRGMALTVTPAKEKAPGEHGQPASYSPAGNPEGDRLVSAPLLKGLELRTDSVTLTAKNLLVAGQGKTRYIGLLLLPQGNASRRIYYGLNTLGPSDKKKDPGRLPRLIITYSRTLPAVPLCASEPSLLATIQSNGRPGQTSPCTVVPTTNVPGSLAHSVVAEGTRTKAPVAYRDRLYVVQKVKNETRLEELSPLGGIIGFVPLGGDVLPGSDMLVDTFGRLRVITNTAIFTAQLGANSPDKTNLPASVGKTIFNFGQVPETVVPGPDGTLYIAKGGIYALNPEVVEFAKDGKVLGPEKLWQVSTANDEKTRITLSPDGHFLYALANFAGGKSRFVAINAQTGKDVQLGTKPPFPDNLNSFRTPVVARGLKGVDFIYITGNSGSGATFWAVQNDPETRNGAFLPRLSEAWTYPLEAKTVVGQPILDPVVTTENNGLAGKKVYFLQGISGVGKTKLTAVSAVDGTKVFEAPEPDGSAAKWSVDAEPVMDKDENIMFWADKTLYGFRKGLKDPFTIGVGSSLPQLRFGPGGTLYTSGATAAGATVNALVPAFQQTDAGPADIYSPTQLYVAGNADRKTEKHWVLRARESVMLGGDFSVKMGETLTVHVNETR
jgi:hypothetical protein